jgi:MarR family transcriptional regulator for hemolysin
LPPTGNALDVTMPTLDVERYDVNPFDGTRFWYIPLMKTHPGGTPIGVLLTNTSRDINRAFDATLEAVGGSRSSWLVLMALKRGPLRNQRELAALVGVEGATLSHHLNGLEAAGLVTRRRDPANRRMHLVELTPAGEDAFLRMLGTVVAFDRKLRAGIDDADLLVVERVMDRLLANLGTTISTTAEFASIPN